jgi:UDP-glucose 4-epimerase
MRSLVTGGAGFIGSNLVDALVARGDEVTVLDDLSSGKRSNLEDALAKSAKLIEGSVADAALVGEVVTAAKPECIFHLAAQIDVRRSITDPAFDLEINVGGTIKMLEAAADAGVRRFAFASTGGAIYGEGEGRDLPLDETADRRPDAQYGTSKMAAEGYLGLYERLRGISTVALRLGNVYGPRQDPHGEAGVVAIFAGALLAGRTPKVFGNGLQTRDYVYVGDVVDAFLAASESDVTGALNIGTGAETDVLELGRIIAAACGKEFRPELAPARAGEVQRISISSKLAARELGWSPQRDLDSALAETVEWARTGLDL